MREKLEGIRTAQEISASDESGSTRIVDACTSDPRRPGPALSSDRGGTAKRNGKPATTKTATTRPAGAKVAKAKAPTAKTANAKTANAKTANARTPETRRRPAEVRRLLVEAAERVIVQKGPAASAQEIAREAGVHRSILYRYYANAEELIREATLRPFRDFLAMFEALAAQPPEEDPRPLWDLLYAFVDTITMSLALHQGFLTKVLADPAAVDEESAATLRRDLTGVIDEIIQFSMTVGESRGLDVPAMAVRGRLVLAMAAGITTYGEWLFPAGEQAMTREQLLEAMVEFILYGAKVVPEKNKRIDRKPPPRLRRTAAL